MSMIQIRHVPEKLHRRLKMRAARAGMSLSEYVLREIRQITERPTLEELTERIKGHEPLLKKLNSAQALREERNHR